MESGERDASVHVQAGERAVRDSSCGERAVRDMETVFGCKLLYQLDSASIK